MSGPDPLVLETVCPRCGSRMDRTIDFEKAGELPEAGDIALCYGCADWAVFTKDRTLRLPTVFEAAEIADNPALVRAAARLRAVKAQTDR
jgi:hypothetical protein